MGGGPSLPRGENTEQRMADTPPLREAVELEYGQLDGRGALRGSCTLCDCDEYDGGSARKKCAICFHPPGQHKKLTRAVTGVSESVELPLENLRISSTGNFDGTVTLTVLL